jgi:hypothetical protein
MLNDSGDVQQRSRDRRCPYPVVRGDLVVGEVGPVELDPLAFLPPARDRDLEPRTSADLPERRGAAVTQRRPGPTGQNGGHPTAVLREEPRPHERVNAALHRTQPPEPKSVIDRIARKTQL